MNRPKKNREPSDSEKSFVIYKVIRTIITSGVTPIPRNYELFYELLSAQNAALSRDILALPQKPEQRLLDKIGKKHHLPGFSDVPKVHDPDSTNDFINNLNVKLLKTIQQIEAAQSSLAQLKLPNNELSLMLRDLLKHQREMQQLLTTELEKLERYNEQESSISAVSTRDTLTGLPNRILFGEKMAELYENGKPLSNACLILANIDRFRYVNEFYGFAQANKALCRIAMVLKRRVKSHDFVARISGNEFAILLHDVPQQNAGAIAERLRLSVKKIRLSPTTLMTMSFGVSDNGNTTSPAEFFAKAELALLASRTGRRDCVSVYDKDVARRSRQAYLMHLKAEERPSRTLA